MATNKNNSAYPSQEPTRKAWRGMINRCYTPTNKDYPAIGGKGITVADEWHDFDTFKRDMGEKPTNTILARYAGGLGFTKENTYWMPKVNARENPLYNTWKGIKRRCGLTGTTSLRHQSYVNRGVEMYDDWGDSFILFETYVKGLGPKPAENYTIDRIDNELGYEPGNIKWSSPKEQANNRSDNIYIEMEGQRKTLQQWCEYYGVERNVVSERWRYLFTANKGRCYPCQRIDIKTGEVLAEYEGVKVAATMTGIKQATISKCLSGGNASAGGFGWHYVK